MPSAEGPGQAIRARTLSDQVRDVLLQRVVAGELAPGGFIREELISAELEVSRTPVREALARLASAGFLERLPHRGYRVPERAQGALLDSYPIIATLEVLAGRLAFPRAAPQDLHALRELNDELSDAVEAGHAAAALDANDRFHAYVADLADNPRLASLLSELRAPLRPLEEWFYSSRANGERSVAEHDSLIRALETGELGDALAIFERNMALTRRVLEERARLPGEAAGG